MAEDLRYLDDEGGEMGWSVPDVGPAVHSIAYKLSSWCVDCYRYAHPTPTEAKAGDLVTFGYEYCSSMETLDVYYIGWRATSEGDPTDYRQLNVLKGPIDGSSTGQCSFAMPNANVTVYIMAEGDTSFVSPESNIPS